MNATNRHDTLMSAPKRAVEPATVVTGRPKLETVARVDPQRFLLWIDGVGGYLVFLGNRITLGQATPETQVDVAVFAEVSRHHATLTRDSEGYLLEALRSVQVNGRKAERVLLQSGDRVTLGTSCQLQFHQPVPISASARLQLVSGHRLRLAVEGVLLMADTLVLGPGHQVHVPMPDVNRTLVLYRNKEGMGLRAEGEVLVNGRPYP